jgi:hypothetical protein
MSWPGSSWLLDMKIIPTKITLCLCEPYCCDSRAGTTRTGRRWRWITPCETERPNMRSIVLPKLSPRVPTMIINTFCSSATTDIKATGSPREVIGPSHRDGSERDAYLLMFLSQSARSLFLPVERIGIDRVVAEVYAVHDMQMGIHAAGQVGGDPKRFLACGIVAVSEHQGGHGPIGRGLGDSNPADA